MPSATLVRTAVLIIFATSLSSVYRPHDLVFQSRALSRSPLYDPKDPFWQQSAPQTFRVSVETSAGKFIVEAHRRWAPVGVDRFYNLVRSGFFDDSRFFRVRAGFIAQFGIAGNPKVAAVWRTQTIADDSATSSTRMSNLRGYVAYAMTGRDTRTTQLFINLADNTRLDAQGFAPVGRVVEGMEIVDKLYSGYGEEAGGGMRGGKQGKIFEEGNAYLDHHFPRLDKLIRARVLTTRGKGAGSLR